MSNEAVRLGEVLRRHGLRLKKGLGQNFLADPVHLDRIVAAAELTADDVVLAAARNWVSFSSACCLTR